jgi:hypothetical protein
MSRFTDCFPGTRFGSYGARVMEQSDYIVHDWDERRMFRLLTPEKNWLKAGDFIIKHIHEVDPTTVLIGASSDGSRIVFTSSDLVHGWSSVPRYPDLAFFGSQDIKTVRRRELVELGRLWKECDKILYYTPKGQRTAAFKYCFWSGKL